MLQCIKYLQFGTCNEINIVNEVNKLLYYFTYAYVTSASAPVTSSSASLSSSTSITKLACPLVLHEHISSRVRKG